MSVAKRSTRSASRAAAGSSSAMASSPATRLDALGAQPGERRFEAVGVAHPRLPAEQLPRLAVAEALVGAHHVHSLTREQRARLQAGRAAQRAVAVLEREAD